MCVWVYEFLLISASTSACLSVCVCVCACVRVCRHVCKCMCIISGRPQNESMSPLALTALNLANRVELFSGELRPLAQQSSPYGDYSKSFPETKELGKTWSHTHVDTFMHALLVAELCLLENARSGGWRLSCRQFGNFTREDNFPRLREQKCREINKDTYCGLTLELDWLNLKNVEILRA